MLYPAHLKCIKILEDNSYYTSSISFINAGPHNYLSNSSLWIQYELTCFGQWPWFLLKQRRNQKKSKEIQMISNTSNLHFFYWIYLFVHLIAHLISRVWLNTQFFSVYGRLYEIIGEYCHNVLLPWIDSPS